MSQRNEVTAIILAGGLSRRMGGKQKALLELNNKPVIQHVIERLKPQVGEILISANSDLDKFKTFGFPVINDELSGHQGPLSGITTCLQHVKTRLILVVPCDVPFLPMDLVVRLSDLQNTSINIAHDGEREQVLIMLFKRELEESLNAALSNNQRKVAEWVHRHQPGKIRFENAPRAFLNINTEDDLNSARLDRGC